METKILDQLEWPKILEQLETFCQTIEGKETAQQLRPTLSKNDVLKRWDSVVPLISLIKKDCLPYIGELQSISQPCQALKIDQVLDGESLYIFAKLLSTVERIFSFTNDFSNVCSTLLDLKSKLYPLPELLKDITKTVDQDGTILDNASNNLLSLRSQKRSLHKQIEGNLNKFSRTRNVEPYIQDDYFTMRGERYVIPIKLDGRGRIPGSIISTSASGQTLFFEPEIIRQNNNQLKELELLEKIEIHQVLKKISQSLSLNLQTLKANYQSLVYFDSLLAEAQLAHKLQANPLTICDEPIINLIDVSHPILKLELKNKAVTNNISLNQDQHILIVSGPNAGGKTVALKTVGITLLMVASGLLPPADKSSKIFLFKNIFIELGDAQDLSKNLSTFSGHLEGLKPILEKASTKDLALLDELCVGTEPQTGSFLAQAILEQLAEKKVWVMATTHYDNIKLFALNNSFCRSAAMGFTKKDYKATYKIQFDLPGLSYGLEVAKQVGFNVPAIERAEVLLGNKTTEFDTAISKLHEKLNKLSLKENELDLNNSIAQQEKSRWQQEVEKLRQKRQLLAEGLIKQYEVEFKTLKEKMTDLFKKAQKDESQKKELKQEFNRTFERFLTTKEQLKDQHIKKQETIGKPADFNKIKAGTNVFIPALGKLGTIRSIGKDPKKRIEVEIGSLLTKVLLGEIRVVEYSPKKEQTTTAPIPKKIKKDMGELPGFFASPTNQVDLRGLTVEEALEKTWDFIGSAIYRGENAILIIHGHGTAQLKKAVRKALSSNPPYDLRFRPGELREGGDGVTVIFF